MTLQAYKNAQATTEDPRATEYRLFGQVTGKLLEVQATKAIGTLTLSAGIGEGRDPRPRRQRRIQLGQSLGRQGAAHRDRPLGGIGLVGPLHPSRLHGRRERVAEVVAEDTEEEVA